MSDILQEIVEHKRGEVAAAIARVSMDEMKRRALDTPTPRNFFTALTRPKDTLRVIAEVKKASPSAGVIREDFDPVAIAQAYEHNGAAAISCLTDEHYFQGSLDYLTAIKNAVKLPVLRKDFIIDPYQVVEARAAGADAILLIAECLTEPLLIDLLILATELKLSTLVEVHDATELDRAVRLGAGLIGINNRDLATFTTDLDTTIRLLGQVPDDVVLVSESGIRNRSDVERLGDAGVGAVLVGESLLAEADPGGAAASLVGVASRPRSHA